MTYSIRGRGHVAPEQDVAPARPSSNNKKSRAKVKAEVKSLPAKVMAQVSKPAYTNPVSPLATRVSARSASRFKWSVKTAVETLIVLQKKDTLAKKVAKVTSPSFKGVASKHVQLINSLPPSSRGKVTSHAAIKSAVMKTLERDTGYGWLERTLKQKLSNESVKLLIECVQEIEALKSVALRFKQIESAKFEKKPLLSSEVLHLAFFIEVRCLKVNNFAKCYFAKGEEGLARALQLDPKTRDVYVIADPDKSSFMAGGSFKTASNVVRLCANIFTSNPEIALQLCPIVNIELLSKMNEAEIKNEKAKIEKVFKHVEVELSCYERFKDVDGIAEFYTASQFTVEVKGIKIPRVSMIFKKASSDLDKMMKNGVKFELSEQLKIAKKLFSFFAAMHEMGFIHGDIKGENVLSYEDKKLVTKIGVTDFGEAFKLHKKSQKLTKPSYMFNDGLYGTVKCTAPELFANFSFKGDFTKTDVWALGCLLYELYFETPAPWQEPLDVYRGAVYDDVSAARKELKEKFVNLVTDHIEKPLAALLKRKKSLSQDEQMKVLIYKLLRLDPAKRLSMQGAGSLAEAIDV